MTRRKVFLFLVCLAISFISVSVSVSAQDLPGEAPFTTNSGEGAVTTPSAPHWFPTTFQQAQSLSRRKLSAGTAVDVIFDVNTINDTVDKNPGNGKCLDDAGKCSLRAAIMEANALTEFVHIKLAAKTYALTIAGADENLAATGDLDITTTAGVNITGAAGNKDTIIDGGDLDRIFHILPGAEVSLSNLVIQNGTSSYGSGLLNEGGSLFGFNLHITANFSTSIAGGMAASAGAYTEIDNSAVTGNQTTFTSGGIDNTNSTMLLTNVTVSGNSAGNGYNAGGIGHSSTGVNYLYIIHGTIVNNAAGLRGGGIRVLEGPVYLQATILGNNSAPDLGPNCYTSSAAAYVVSLGYTHIQNTTDCQYFASDNDLTTPPQVGSLADNGGKTPTHALPPSSSHRESIPAENCGATTDQRGVRRPQDANNNGIFTCDVGAYEHAGPFMLLQPLPNEVLDHPTGVFVWMAEPRAAQYRLDVQGVGFAFDRTVNGNANQFCAGIVCSAAINLNTLPQSAKLEWRVRATLPSGSVATLWQPFSLNAPGVPVLTNPINFATLLPANFGGIQWGSTPQAGRLRVKVIDAFSGDTVFSKNYTANSTPPLGQICSSTTCSLSSAALGITTDVGRAYRWFVQAEATINGREYQTKSQTFYFSFVPASLTVTGGQESRVPIDGFRAP